MKFQVLILEHLQHFVEVEAPDADAAMRAANERAATDPDFGLGELVDSEAVDASPMVTVECDSEDNWTGTLDAWLDKNGKDAALSREVEAAINRGETFDHRDETHGVYLKVTPA